MLISLDAHLRNLARTAGSSRTELCRRPRFDCPHERGPGRNMVRRVFIWQLPGPDRGRVRSDARGLETRMMPRRIARLLMVLVALSFAGVAHAQAERVFDV